MSFGQSTRLRTRTGDGKRGKLPNETRWLQPLAFNHKQRSFLFRTGAVQGHMPTSRSGTDASQNKIRTNPNDVGFVLFLTLSSFVSFVNVGVRLVLSVPRHWLLCSSDPVFWCPGTCPSCLASFPWWTAIFRTKTQAVGKYV